MRCNLLFLCAFCLTVGCGPWVGDTSVKDEKKPTVESVWTCVADDVDAGDYENSDQLILAVDHLRERSRVTDDGVTKFNESFPEFRKEGGTRKLTHDDATKLRGL